MAEGIQGTNRTSSTWTVVFLQDLQLMRDFAWRIVEVVRVALRQVVEALSHRFGTFGTYLVTEFTVFAVLHQFFGNVIHRIQTVWNYAHRWCQNATLIELQVENRNLKEQVEALNAQLTQLSMQGAGLVAGVTAQREAISHAGSSIAGTGAPTTGARISSGGSAVDRRCESMRHSFRALAKRLASLI
jgi:hypothetical protein